MINFEVGRKNQDSCSVKSKIKSYDLRHHVHSLFDCRVVSTYITHPIESIKDLLIEMEVNNDKFWLVVHSFNATVATNTVLSIIENNEITLIKNILVQPSI